MNRNRVKHLYLGIQAQIIFWLGVFFVILGLIGVFLPILPTVPFILLAAWCFFRTSPKAHAWLHRQPYFGEALQRWEEKRAIRRSAKILAILTICISLASIWWRLNILWLQIVITCVLTAASVFIVTRPED